MRPFNYVVLITLIVLLIFTPGESSAQTGLIDDLVQAAAKGARTASRGGRGAESLTDDAGRLLRKAPASAATRKAFGISLSTAAAEALYGITPVPGRIRVYLGVDGSDLKFIPDTYSGLWDHSNLPETNTLSEYLDALQESGQHVEGVDYVVEVDVVKHPAFRSARFNSEDKLLLARYGGRSWPLRQLSEEGDYLAEVKPSLLVRVADEVIEDLTSLLDLTFDGKDMRLVSLFDPEADLESVEAVRTAAAGATAYKNLLTKEEALSVIAERRGQIVAVVGHVEDQSFVVRNALGQEQFRVGIQELNEAAQQKDVSLILLGCETARIPDVAGMVDQVNSLAIAAQLQRALDAHSYGDFLAALGTQEVPFVVTADVIDQARVLVANRIKRDTRAYRAGVVTAYVTPKLVQAQAANTQQLFRSIPRWLDDAIAGVTALVILAFIVSPMKSILILVRLLIRPFAALLYVVERLYRLIQALA